MNELRSFAPLYTRTGPLSTPAGRCLPSVTVVAVDATAVPSAVFPGQISNNAQVQIRIANKTSAWVHIQFGVLGAVVAATVNDFPVAPGDVVVVSVDSEVNAASVFASGTISGSTSVIFTRGSGIA